MFPNATSFLMIDDDEIASRDWLEQMVSAAETTGADIVGGPVLPEFDDERKRGLRRHPAFAPAYDASGPVPVIYGCGNCLIRRPVFARLADPAFDLRFNFLGGGDTDFFWRCRLAGMTFHWVEEAVITETVPESRTKPRWIALRGLRIGAINYHVQRKAAQTSWRRFKLTLKMLAMLPLSLFHAGRLVLTEHRALDGDAPDDGRGRQRAGGDRHRTAALQGLEDHVSQLAITSGFHIVVGEVRRQQVLDVVRSTAFIGTLLLAWISLRPFADLGELQIGDVSTGNEAPTYLAFGGLAVLMVALAMRDNMRGLASLLTPAFMLFAAWICRDGRPVVRPLHLDQALCPDRMRDRGDRDA